MNETIYKPIACLDTETCNHDDLERSLLVCWTFGLVVDDELTTYLGRTIAELNAKLQETARLGITGGFTPVVMVHNLAYDLHFIMPYIKAAANCGYRIECCWKSSVKPLNIRLMRNGKCDLCFWDTLSFSGMSLAKMGKQCGFEKLTGNWDYDAIRHAQTDLDNDERDYAMTDVMVPFIWLRQWLNLNPEIPEDKLGLRILTKTSAVRWKCRNAVKNKIYREWVDMCRRELPKDANTYNLMIRSTSAGWAFTASENAGIAFDNAVKYDATSMHPSHMISHMYPVQFHDVTNKNTMRNVVARCFSVTPAKILKNWIQPFDFAFNARIRFDNLRLRHDTVFANDGIALHGSALFSDYDTRIGNEDSESSDMEFNAINAEGYDNSVIGGVYEFGKLVSADSCVICLNELNAWVHAQVYEWDSFEVLQMSATGKFEKPPEYVLASVKTMLKRKQVVKSMMRGVIGECPDFMPAYVYSAFRRDPSSRTCKDYYALVKSDLNSLYGMFATNELKQSIVYDNETESFVYDGIRGLDKHIKTPKAWYQFGMRVAAWSRVQQCIAMLSIATPKRRRIVNGDTDSFCFTGKNTDVEKLLEPLHKSIRQCIAYIAGNTSEFDGLGEYVLDLDPELYCAVANKRYAYKDEKGLHTKSAGVPTANTRAALEYEFEQTQNFAQATVDAIGYNACYIGVLSGCKRKVAPEYGETLNEPFTVVDKDGLEYTYPHHSPTGIFLAESDKILGAGYDTDHSKCCRNAGIIQHHALHHYELNGDHIERWEPWES